MLIQTKDLVKIYRMGGTDVRALDGVSVDIDEGDFVAVMGPSGSGKSTFMNRGNNCKQQSLILKFFKPYSIWRGHIDRKVCGQMIKSFSNYRISSRCIIFCNIFVFSDIDSNWNI